MNKTTTALEAGLDAAAPDGERWNAGLEAYKASQQEDPGNDEKAYYAALDAAAPDKDSWIEGNNALVLHGVRLVPVSKDSVRVKNSVKDRLKKEHAKTGDNHWTAKPFMVFAFRMLVYGIGAIFFALLRPIVDASYNTEYGAPTGIIASVVLFVALALIFWAVGEGLIRLARKSARTTPTESTTS
jgi:hypothetical protein